MASAHVTFSGDNALNPYSYGKIHGEGEGRMKIHQLMDILATMDPEAEVFVALFNADGTGDTYDIEEVTAHNGDVQIEIYEEEPGA
jgi:hypothetical protein